LPNYIDGLTAAETAAEVNEHLGECGQCRAVYEKMMVQMNADVAIEEKNIDFMRKLRAGALRKSIIAASICLVLLAGLWWLVFRYETAVPFDSERIWVEVMPIAAYFAADEYGRETHGSAFDSDGNYDDLIEEGWIIRNEVVISTINTPTYSWYLNVRDIHRDDEDLRLVFFSFTHTPFIRLLYSRPVGRVRGGGWMSGFSQHELYGDTRLYEIYYLPNLHNIWDVLHNMPDEDLDALRRDGILVWRGVVENTAPQP